MKYDVSKCIIALVKYCKNTSCTNCKLFNTFEDLPICPLDIDTSELPHFGEVLIDIDE